MANSYPQILGIGKDQVSKQAQALSNELIRRDQLASLSPQHLFSIVNSLRLAEGCEEMYFRLEPHIFSKMGSFHRDSLLKITAQYLRKYQGSREFLDGMLMVCTS
jgi:hypothetical protein